MTFTYNTHGTFEVAGTFWMVTRDAGTKNYVGTCKDPPLVAEAETFEELCRVAEETVHNFRDYLATAHATD